ncbi:ATPase [Aureococcus anophagefferens]|nr:ATPase [Aureococcus anophagefferens]
MSGDDDADGKHNAWLSPEMLALRPSTSAAARLSREERQVLLVTRRRGLGGRQADAAAASDRAVQRRRAAAGARRGAAAAVQRRCASAARRPRPHGAAQAMDVSSARALRRVGAQLRHAPTDLDGALAATASLGGTGLGGLGAVRAAKYGRCLVVDEADKTPLEVVCVLKALLEDGELTMSDGRRVVARRAGAARRPGDVGAHAGFRVIVLANRPGWPFLGNDFYRECGDVLRARSTTTPTTLLKSSYDIGGSEAAPSTTRTAWNGREADAAGARANPAARAAGRAAQAADARTARRRGATTARGRRPRTGRRAAGGRRADGARRDRGFGEGSKGEGGAEATEARRRRRAPARALARRAAEAERPARTVLPERAADAGGDAPGGGDGVDAAPGGNDDGGAPSEAGRDGDVAGGEARWKDRKLDAPHGSGSPRLPEPRLNLVRRMASHAQYCRDGDATLSAAAAALRKIRNVAADAYLVVLCLCLDDFAAHDDDFRARALAECSSDWRLMGETLDGGEAALEMGESVAISGNGVTMVAGGSTSAPGRDHLRYEYGAWNLRGSPVHGDYVGEQFGKAVDVSDKADVIAVSAPKAPVGDDAEAGEARLELLRRDGWKHMGTNLFLVEKDDSKVQADDAEFGYSLSLSGQGERIAIGAPGQRFGRGRVHTYAWTRNENIGVGAWVKYPVEADGSPKASALFGECGTRDESGACAFADRLGSKVKLSSSGENLVVSSPTAGQRIACNDTTATSAELAAHAAVCAERGWRTRISGRVADFTDDANIVAIGAPTASTEGAADAGRVEIWRDHWMCGPPGPGALRPGGDATRDSLKSSKITMVLKMKVSKRKVVEGMVGTT